MMMVMKVMIMGYECKGEFSRRGDQQERGVGNERG
jgi:hypothetical protein